MTEPLPFDNGLFFIAVTKYAKEIVPKERKFHLQNRTWGEEYDAYVAGLASDDADAQMLHELYAVELMKRRLRHG